MKNKNVWRGISATSALLLAILIPATSLMFDNKGSINQALGITVDKTTEEGAEYTYKSTYTADGKPSEEGLKKLLQDEKEFCATEQGEGSVLVKNGMVGSKKALPLASDETRVTLFGRASADPIYRCNSAGPAYDMTRLVTLKGALEEAGFAVNETMYNAYANSTTKRVAVTANASIGEESKEFYTQDLKNSYANDYNDVAIVVLAREGGEGNDLSLKDKDGVNTLALHPQEKDLLNMIHESGKFKKVILLVNSGYAMELGWLDEYHVDACLWIGNPGIMGFTGVANILKGTVNPSGKFVDTYATSALSSAAVQNFGDYKWTNVDEAKKTCTSDFFSNYVVEAEGIYVGYKYYETRYEDCILGVGGANSSAGATQGSTWNYADEIAYPFGYGLSYTTFEQEIGEAKLEGETFKIPVTVTNTGDVAGKSVVEMYVQSPYTQYDKDNLVEKSAVQVVDFEKTDILEPGQSATVTVEVDKYLLASYDYVNAKGYILDEGDYIFAVGANAHDALNNILASKGATGMFDIDGTPVSGNVKATWTWNLDKFDDTSYRTSKYSGQEVTNIFDEVDLNHWGTEKVTYLTRQDWANTFPKPMTVTLTKEMMVALDNNYVKSSSAPAIDSFTQGVDSNIKFVDLKEVAFDDEETWEKFLNQLSVSEMATFISDSSGSEAITSVGKPASKNTDGPDGYCGSYQFGEKLPCTTYVNQIVAASTWNKELLTQRGHFYAEDVLYAGGTQGYCPGGNLHRTPFNGRNFEYYSEDGYFSYLCAATQCKALSERGILAGIKHFVANDQETNRWGVATFMNEQAFRQGPLKGFEGAFTVGGTLLTMGSYNRVGLKPASACYELLTTLLRGEWGYQGYVITDAANSTEYMQSIPSLIAGSDLFCMSNRTKDIATEINRNKNGEVLEALRLANKRMFYAFSRSVLVNGLSHDTTVSDFIPWWQPAMIAIDVVFGLIAVGGAVMFVLNEYVFGAKNGKKENGNG